MALRKNTKLASEKRGVGLKIYSEVHLDPAVDDVMAFMAQSEAHRRYVLRPRGVVRDTQVPSDEVKHYLMKLDT